MRIRSVAEFAAAVAVLLPLALLALATSASFGQVLSAPLHVMDQTSIPSLQLHSAGFRAVMGLDGFYVQTGPTKYMAVNLDGQVHTALDTSRVEATNDMDPASLFVIDVSPSPRGGLIAPVVWTERAPADQKPPQKSKQRFGILRFDQDGDYDDLIEINVPFRLRHVAEFSSSGGFLVTGVGDDGTLHAAVLDNRGQIVVPQVSLWGKARPPVGKRTADETQQAMTKAAIEAGEMQVISGDDDAVYLYDPALGSKVARVASSGKISQIALAAAPLPNGATALPLALYISHSTLYLDEALIEGKPATATELKHFLLCVYDNSAGALKASYKIDSSYGAVPVALSPREFYFLDAKVGYGSKVNFSIVKVSP